MNITAKELLIGAKQVIVIKGWCQGQYSIGGKCCMIGAMNQVETGDPDRLTFSRASCDAYRALNKVTGVLSVATFNDAPRRKLAEVLEAFDKAIAYTETGAACST